MTGPAIMGHAWRALRLSGVLAAFLAAGIAYAIWQREPVKPVAGGKPIEGLDVISLQIDILGLTLAAIGIGLAVMALFGYQALKEAAEARAERVAKETVDTRMTILEEQIRQRTTDKVGEMLPVLVEEYMKVTGTSAAGFPTGDTIAGTQNEVTQ